MQNSHLDSLIEFFVVPYLEEGIESNKFFPNVLDQLDKVTNFGDLVDFFEKLGERQDFSGLIEDFFDQ